MNKEKVSSLSAEILERILELSDSLILEIYKFRNPEGQPLLTKNDYEILYRKYCGINFLFSNKKDNVQRRLEQSLDEMNNIPIFLKYMLFESEIKKRKSNKTIKTQEGYIKTLREEISPCIERT